MKLADYRRRRNFKVTREPRGGRVTKRDELKFVIQKHAASHLHYDFRLELDGVLLSWAVPKGPSLDPSQKRLAMHVEDHPLEYGDFEGIIPQGEYGGGTVLVWDRGTWEPLDDPRKAFRVGALKFVLHGEKLKGRWMLVRKGGKRSAHDEKHWFLFKERDEFAQTDLDLAAAEPRSVLTGRDLDEIAVSADRVWGRNGEIPQNGNHATRITRATRNQKHSALRAAAGPNGRGSKTATGRPRELSAINRKAMAKFLRQFGTKRSSVPTNAKLQLATLVSEPPSGDQWGHEIKFDGYRMLCRIKQGEKTRFISRNGKDWTMKFADLALEAAKLPIKNALIDGEVVILDAEGRSSFQLMQNAFKASRSARFLFYAFDLIFLNGYDVGAGAAEGRKAILEQLIPQNSGSVFRYSEHLVGRGAELFAEAARLKLEGIVSKRLDRPYVPGRGYDWLKTKCSFREEFVVGGFTKPSGGREHFGALLLGYHDRAINSCMRGVSVLALTRTPLPPYAQRSSR